MTASGRAPANRLVFRDWTVLRPAHLPPRAATAHFSMYSQCCPAFSSPILQDILRFTLKMYFFNCFFTSTPTGVPTVTNNHSDTTTQASSPSSPRFQLRRMDFSPPYTPHHPLKKKKALVVYGFTAVPWVSVDPLLPLSPLCPQP